MSGRELGGWEAHCERMLKMQLIQHNAFVLFACLFREWFSAKPKDRRRRVTGQHALLAWEGLLQLCLQGLDPVGETFRWSVAHTLKFKHFPVA